MPKFILDVSEKEYNEAGSKFVNVGIPTLTKADVNKVFYFPIECENLDWDTVGKSMKIDTVVVGGVNNGHKEKISFGVDAKGIWKGKLMYKAISKKDMPMGRGEDKLMHPEPDSDDINGKKAVGVWQVVEGLKGGDPNANATYYPKLQDIFAADFKPADAKASGLGI